ncbi:hypothetical protein [Mycetocola saprophilus]|uniref:hypothetical protein n=1 Tax=Mycetocola saprophilus TaxID=76636 RepID=UPI003BF371A5
MNTHPTSPRRDNPDTGSGPAESNNRHNPHGGGPDGRPAEPNEHELADAFEADGQEPSRRLGEPERDDDDLTSLDAPD